MTHDNVNESSSTPGRVRSFLFEQLDIRGIWVQLDQTWRDMITGRDYSLATTHLLGEMAAVTALLAANLKQPGRLTFQLRGEGEVKRLVMICNEHLQLRGMAHQSPELASGALNEVLGEGYLTITLEGPDMRQPYQSQVPLQGDTLSGIFEHYLMQSDQQAARLWLAADTHIAAGLFLQALPGAATRDEDGWNRIQILADTLKPAELLQLGSIDLLARLFPEEDVRVYDPRPVVWHCPEDWAKIGTMLRSIGRSECEAILHDVGEVHVHDDICNRDYRLNAQDVAQLFDEGNSR